LVTFLTLLCFNLVLTLNFPKSEDCDVPDKAELDDKLDKLIRNLPYHHLVNDTKLEMLQGAIFLGEGILTGLRILKQDKPYETFCRDKDTVTVFSFRCKHSLLTHVPWRLCSWHSGTILFEAGLVRFEGELVTRKTNSGTEYRIQNVIPVLLERLKFRVKDGGEIVSAFTGALGFILSGLARSLWVSAITPSVEDAFQKTLMELN
ncbi:uncharacterized protein LOC120839559, partial [Ixodes scapularis]|uniref:uncharacterized protein LOC120839559 n=1 Tax=Ixodes scapularis TaxID=6945 RepID=UPI001A9E5B54